MPVCPPAPPRDRRPPHAARGAPEPRTPHPKGANEPEQKVAGKNACRALFETRPSDIRRVYVTDDNVRAFGDCLKWCAANRIAYHIAYHIKESADLDAVAETVHHDGVCFIARLKKPVTLDEVVARVGRARTERAIVVLLADVKNPHNLGAILRVCAHFGVAGVLAVRDTPALSPAAMRTAAGGAEHVDVVPVDDVADAIDRLKRAGLSVVATSSHTEHAFGQGTLPSRALVMFGSEGEGLSRELLEQADIVIAIPGSGALESLNVA